MLQSALMFACQDYATGKARFGLLQMFTKASPQIFIGWLLLPSAYIEALLASGIRGSRDERLGWPPSSFTSKWQTSLAADLRLIKLAYLLKNPPHGQLGNESSKGTACPGAR
jgi:hypothetical protein